jgi:hypothetical protein
MKQTAFRLTDTDLALLDTAQERIGLTSRTEALRYMIRQWAERSGVELPKPKRTTTKKKR